MRLTPQTLRGRLRRFGADTGGTTAVIAAMLFPVLIGGLGLGAETGYWYMTQRKLQHVADVSAHAAGTRLRAADTDQQIVATARHVASQSGYSGMPELAVDPHYTSAAHPGVMLVEVIATDTQPRLFSAVVAGFFSSEPQLTVTMSARAVAQVDASEASRACVLALSTTAARAITVTGSSTLALEGCDLASNSNDADALYVTSDTTTGCAYSVGGAYTPGLELTGCDAVKENAPLVRDPYAHIAEPAFSAVPCENPKVLKANAATTLTPVHPHESGVAAMRFCGDLNAMGTVTFDPGLYIVEGALRMTSSNPASRFTGEGVTFYFPDKAEMRLTGTDLDLAAPESGPFAGLLFFGSRSATTANHNVGGHNNSILTGAIYTPASAITISGNAEAIGGGCTQVIGDTVTFTGNSTLQSTCDEAGTIEIVTNEMVGIVE